MAIQRNCYYCGGSGELQIYHHETGQTETMECYVCSGTGKLFWGTDDELPDIMDRCNDILDKCNDILDKCNDILDKLNE